jgi:hypothetical protein
MIVLPAVHSGGYVQFLIRVGAGLMLADLVAGAVVYADKAGAAERPEATAHFSDWERVAMYCHDNPGLTVRLLEQHLTQEQIDALEQAMFPEPSPDQKQAVYRRVQTGFRRLELPSEDTLIQAISAHGEASGGAETSKEAP